VQGEAHAETTTSSYLPQAIGCLEILSDVPQNIDAGFSIGTAAFVGFFDGRRRADWAFDESSGDAANESTSLVTSE